MGKKAHDNMIDGALNYLKTNCDRLFLCTTEPADYTEASTTKCLATYIIDSSDFTGPANGDASGRKITVNQQSGNNASAGGDAQHVALCKSGTTELSYVDTCTLQTVTSGNPVTINAFDIEIADPT